MNRQKRALLWLLALLCLSGLYAWWAAPVQQRVDRAGSGTSEDRSGTGPGRRGAVTTADDRVLHLELLERGNEDLGQVTRDLFSFKVMAPPPAPPPPPPPKIEQPLPPPPPPQVQPVPVSPAAARFGFVGSLQKDGRKLVFLSSGQDIYLVAEGQRFGRQDEFRLQEIGEKALRIEQQGLAQLITVQTAEPEVRADGVSGPGLALPADDGAGGVQDVPHPLRSYNQSLPRMRNFKRQPINP